MSGSVPGKRATAGLMLLAMFSAPAAANDEKSCFSNGPDQIIRGCSRIISKGQAARSKIGMAHGSRGWAFVRKKQYDKAIADFTKAISIVPDRAHYYFYRGRAFDEKAQYDQAITDYTESIRRDPNKVGAYVNRGIIYARKDQRNKAIDDFRKALEIRPTLEIVRRNLKRLGAGPGSPPPDTTNTGKSATSEALDKMPDIEGLEKLR